MKINAVPPETGLWGNLLGNEYREEEFTSRKLRRKAAGKKKPVVVSTSTRLFPRILETVVPVTGGEVATFVRDYEAKLGAYLGKPFLRLLTDGLLLRGLKNFNKYVLGAAICKHYQFPRKRFIEAQFHYHDQWKNCAPTIHYATSLHSEWNSVGRYKDYCERYSAEIDYFGDGEDNINLAYKVSSPQLNKNPLNSSLVSIYEEMILFQSETKKITKKEAIKILGYPGKELIPVRYLKTLEDYLELVDEDAWGPSVTNIDFYRKLKIQIENSKYAG